MLVSTLNNWAQRRAIPAPPLLQPLREGDAEIQAALVRAAEQSTAARHVPCTYLGVRFADGDRPRFENRHRLFDLFQKRADTMDWADLSARLAEKGTTFERYRTMHEAANDAQLVANNPLFGPSPANPSEFEYPATRSFANIPSHEAGDPAPAPYLGQHTEEVLADRLGLASGTIHALVDRGIARLSDKD